MPNVQLQTAKNGTDPAELDQLARASNHTVRHIVAGNRHAATDTLRWLDQRDKRHGYKLAGNPACPPDLLRRYAQLSSTTMRTRVAGNRNTPPDILTSLTADEDPEVVEMALGNPVLPPDVVERWMATKTGRDLAWLAVNSALSVPQLTVLAANADTIVKNGVANNRNAPGWLLDQLEPGAHGSLRTAIMGHRNCPAPVQLRIATEHPGTEHFYAAIRNRGTTPEVLLTICQSKTADPLMRARVASRKPTCVAALELLAADEWASVRKVVAGNPDCPAGVLERLLYDLDGSVAQQAAYNPATPRYALAMWQLANGESTRL